MENNWPETIDELMEECRMLVSKTDLYELGERGEPFTGESEPRVDGTYYLAGEYQYGVAMIPAQWVTHVLGNATLGRGECEWVLREKWPNRTGDDHVYGYETSCGARHTWWPDSLPNFCPTCGERVKAVKR